MKLLQWLFPIWMTIAYDRITQQGIMVEVYKICAECSIPRRSIVDKEISVNSQRNHYDFDSLFITYANSTDVYEVNITGIKRGYVCSTFTDTLKTPYFRKSYGVTFFCDTIISTLDKSR